MLVVYFVHLQDKGADRGMVIAHCLVVQIEKIPSSVQANGIKVFLTDKALARRCSKQAYYLP